MTDTLIHNLLRRHVQDGIATLTLASPGTLERAVHPDAHRAGGSVHRHRRRTTASAS